MPLDYQVFDAGNVRLQRGETLRDCKLAYKTFGKMNPARDNVIVYPTWYSGQHYDNEWLIGPCMALDPDKYFIIIPNMIGNGLSSSPSNMPAPYNGARFPRVTACDNVRLQHRLVTEKFFVKRLALAQAGRWARCRRSIGARSIPTWSSASRRSAARPNARATISCSSKA
jgi:homoserine O-acetyltransferase